MVTQRYFVVLWPEVETVAADLLMEVEVETEQAATRAELLKVLQGMIAAHDLGVVERAYFLPYGALMKHAVWFTGRVEALASPDKDACSASRQV